MEWLTRPAHRWLWEDRRDGNRPPPWLTLSRLTYALVRDIASGELTLRAMSLVYTTILAVVPLLAFSFAVLKGLGFHRTLEPMLERFLEPVGPQSAEVAARVLGFVDNVSGSALATVSMVLLVFSALSMAQKVEASFNFVWRVDRPRSFARRFSEYLTVMLLWPLLMSVAMGLAATLTARATRSRLAQADPFGDWLVSASELVPYVLIIAVFCFLYVFVPNTRVRFRPALIAGAAAGIVWGAGGTLFARIVASASRTEAIYSGFAIVIVTMLWLYLSWLVLLVGAQLSFYLQNPSYLRFGRRTESLSGALRERLALATMVLIGLDFEHPTHGWSVEGLAARLRLPHHYVDTIVGTLADAGLVSSTSEQRLIPARDPRRITVAAIVDAVRRTQDSPPDASSEVWSPSVRAVAERIDAAVNEALGAQTLASLLEIETEAAAATAPEPERGG